MKAIKLYETMPSDDENVLKGISGKIPALVVDLEVTLTYPIDETFIQMSDEKYNAYLVSIKPELEAWQVIQEAQPIQIPQE